MMQNPNEVIPCVECGAQTLAARPVCNLCKADEGLIPKSTGPKMKPEGPFEIMINEWQRKLVVRAMEVALKDDDFVLELKATTTEGDDLTLSDNSYDEMVDLLDMTKNLPKNNEAGVTHGFCL